MKFKFFSPDQPTTTVSATDQPSYDRQRIEDERSLLTALLYATLERLPQATDFDDSVQQLCNSLVDTTNNLRYIWVGLREHRGQPVPPLVVAGGDASASADWRLAESCFDFNQPYSQASLEGLTASATSPSLFGPWQHQLDASPVNCALAIPLRSERSGVRGLMVFYATDIDYFSHLGVAAFQAFGHLVEVMLKQGSLLQILAQKTQADPLTGLMNRRRTVLVLTKAMEVAEQSRQPISILLCRVEGFDKLNDVYGWFDADAILAAFVKNVGSQMPLGTPAGRWTGVEFLYVLHNCDRTDAAVQATQLRNYLQAQTISVLNWSIRLTVSIGIATHTVAGNSLDDLLYQASQQMLTLPQ